jgi:putative ABC transport system permease protein
MLMLRTLLHHKAIVVLVVLQVAISYAVTTNSIYLMQGHWIRSHLTTGLDDGSLVIAQVTGVDGSDMSDAEAIEDMASIRAVNGVDAVSEVNMMPASKSAFTISLYAAPRDSDPVLRRVPMYLGKNHYMEALGIRLIQGRPFADTEYVKYDPFRSGPYPFVAVITSSLAKRIWPGADALGKTLYVGQKKFPVRVVGITGHLMSSDFSRSVDSDITILMPTSTLSGGVYVAHVSKASVGAVSDSIRDALYKVDPNRMVQFSIPYSTMVEQFFRHDRFVVYMLLAVVLVLVVLATAGVAALSMLWIRQRTRSIGIRRALGATVSDIVQYFLTENVIVVFGGLVLGVGLSIALNDFLISHFEVQRLSFLNYAFSSILFLAIGQIAALYPVVMGSKMQPAMAMRRHT